MKIQCLYDALVPIDNLKSHPRNRNEHPSDQVIRLSEILEYQGWRYPVKISKRSGYITSGHGRVMAAKINNWKEVPVNYQDYESEEQEYADIIADNSIASWAELNFSQINTDIQELGPFDIKQLGIKNFNIEPADKFKNDDFDTDISNDRYILEIELPNQDEMNTLCDELTNRGLIVRVKNV